METVNLDTTTASEQPSYRYAALPWSDRAGLLTTIAMGRLKQKFASHQHSPSPTAWTALEALLATMEEAAKGNLEPRVYLSSLDCGVGKSSAIAAFIDALLSYNDFDHVGVVLCVNRLEEIERFVSEACIPSDAYAVFTSNDDLNALGLGKANSQKARVLFTTHAMTERLCAGRPFSSIEELSFNGKPRQVRIWDEQLLFGRGVTLSGDDIAALFRRFNGTYPKVRRILEAIQADIRAAKDGSVFTMPDLELSGVSSNDVARLLANNDEDRRVASALWFLSGRVVTIRKDGAFGNTALDYEETLPPDIKPLIVTDASGRVRATYRAWEESRGDLVRLPTAPKRYEALTCRVWRTSGAKSAFSKREQELCEGVAKAIDQRQGQSILVLTHKARDGRYDVERTVRALVKGDQTQLHFLTWGSHTSVNRYAHCSTTIVAGTLHYRASTIEGLARAAKGMTTEDGKVPYAELKEIELGESRHNLLQGSCRGSMRRCIGDQCAPSELLLIASEKSGIPKALPELFPGCRVEAWRPIVRPLEGKLKDGADYLSDWAEVAALGAFLPFKVLMGRLGIASVTTFRKQVRDNEAFRAVVAELGLSPAPRKANGKYPQGYRKIDFGAVFADPEADAKDAEAAERARIKAEQRGDF